MSIKRWLPIIALIFYIGLVIRSSFLVALSITLIVVFALAYWWQKNSLRGIEYHRRFHYTRAFPGEVHPVTLEIENRKLLPLTWLRVQDSWAEAVAPTDEGILSPSHISGEGLLVHVMSLRWYERTLRRYELLFRKRGVYKIGPVRIASGDMFGMYERVDDLALFEDLTIFPRLAPIQDMDLPPENPFGDQRSRRRLFEDPNRPMGVREYHPEDSFRRVHWPATARTSRLQVKVFQPTSAQVLVVCLNVSTYYRYWEGVYPELLEHLLSLSATLVSEGIQDGYRVGLISNGCLTNSDQPFRIPPGRSPKQLSHLLQALAGVTPVVTAPFEQFLLREVPKVPYGATLLIVTAVTSPELSEILLRLKKHERQITLLSLAQDPPSILPGVKCIHLPFKEVVDEGLIV